MPSGEILGLPCYASTDHVPAAVRQFRRAKAAAAAASVLLPVLGGVVGGIVLATGRRWLGGRWRVRRAAAVVKGGFQPVRNADIENTVLRAYWRVASLKLPSGAARAAVTTSGGQLGAPGPRIGVRSWHDVHGFACLRTLDSLQKAVLRVICCQCCQCGRTIFMFLLPTAWGSVRTVTAAAAERPLGCHVLWSEMREPQVFTAMTRRFP